MIVQFLKERITGGKPKVSRAEVLASKPLRNPKVPWDREAVRPDTPPVALLRIPRRSDRFGNAVARIFKLPDYRKLELDEIGSDVWEMCDGANSVEAITKKVVERYKLNRRQAETSVTAYLRMLAQRQLVILKRGTGTATRKSKKA
ncbi:MAG: PqqD family protein [Capsulimonadales bacterium]|nr:PqqD family protein [Capsulimonadales bacterium]